jgi:quinol---cytochrome c reductase iron-sulfur subunit
VADAEGGAVSAAAGQRTGDVAPGGSTGPRPPGWPVGLGLVLTIGGAVGFVVAYFTDAANWWIGGCLAVALLGLGTALAYWGRDLAGDEVASGPYPVPHDDPGGRDALASQLDADAGVITRRGFLAKLLAFAAVVFGVSMVALAASLGPWTTDARPATGWRRGTRLVTDDGQPVTRDVLASGGFLVAFPEGHTEAANSQVALLHFVDGGFKPLPGRETWSPEGFVAYSRVCTHAGCAVAQYLDEAQVLLCPCHQSTFDVLDGARPVAGPAGRALPQLPLAIDAQGYLVAQSDFTEPVGPGYWNMT